VAVAATGLKAGELLGAAKQKQKKTTNSMV
jgi:hypothetical protein